MVPVGDNADAADDWIAEARVLRLKQSRCRRWQGLPFRPERTGLGCPSIGSNRPARLDNFYGTRVCAVDTGGNEVARLRLPPIAVPLGTYTGWNVYRAQSCELCGRDGSLIRLHAPEAGATLPTLPAPRTLR
jgi:hypothetical protein